MKLARIVLLAVCLIWLSGCGKSKTGAASVTGMVKYKGEIVPAGIVQFHTPDKGVYSTNLDKDGKYSITDVPPGDVVVTVDTKTIKDQLNPPDYGAKMGGKKTGGGGGPTPQDMMNMDKGGGGKAPAGGFKGGNSEKPIYKEIPAKYADKAKSDLKFKIDAGRQEKNFDLTD